MPSLTTCVSKRAQLIHSCIKSLKKYQRFGLEGSVSSRRRSALGDVLSVRKRGRTCSQAPTPLLSPVGISCPFQLPPLTTVDAFSPCRPLAWLRETNTSERRPQFAIEFREVVFAHGVCIKAPHAWRDRSALAALNPPPLGAEMLIVKPRTIEVAAIVDAEPRTNLRETRRGSYD